MMNEQDSELKQTTEACGPGCSCGTGGGSSKMKWVVCGVVLLVAAGVVTARVTSKNKVDSQKSQQGYAEVVPAVVAVDATKRLPDADGWGTPLRTLAELNLVATNTEAVFVVVPSSDGIKTATVQKEVLIAASTINTRGTKIGTFLLSRDAREYSELAQQVGVPAVIAMYKGRGMSAVADKQGITQDNLLKAFVGASRPPAAGCGPSGCGPGAASCN
ncbi:MAG: hypothetical protein C0404_09335 [Verrucomicrobia bacterium]|nr:hypothetical protein [Verrucomicrobiota bacterium]